VKEGGIPLPRINDMLQTIHRRKDRGVRGEKDWGDGNLKGEKLGSPQQTEGGKKKGFYARGEMAEKGGTRGRGDNYEQ